MHLNSGFTLVELMVVLGIISLLVYFSNVANVGNLFSKASVSTSAVSMHSALNYARNESLSRGSRPVTFCRPNATATACDNAASWNKGWMVISTNNDGSDDIRVFPSDFGNNTDNTIVKTGNANTIVFRNGNADQHTTFIFCSADGMGANAREVIVTMAGRVRTVAGNDPSAPIAVCDPNNP